MDKIIIKDSGIGMEPEFIPHIFEAFSQEDATRTSIHQGTGLGMSITKQILTFMGGDIWVESEPGKGTEVSIILPLHEANEEQIREWESKKPGIRDEKILKDKRVLLCEDNPLNAEIAIQLLQEKGMIVDHATDGSIGVKLFEESKVGYYDLILMDIRMPVMDGLDATRRIRSLDREDSHSVPVAAMTANAFDEDVQQTKEAGMNGHISKPIDTKLMYETLEDLLSQ